MRKIVRNQDHLYYLLKAYEDSKEPLSWPQALKKCDLAMNKQEFELLTNLAARAKLLSGKMTLKKRTEKYWREHHAIEPSDFTYVRKITHRGKDFLAAYEIVQRHMSSVYPEQIEGRPMPPEQVTFQITGKPYHAPDGQLMLPVRIIEIEPDEPESSGS